MATDDRVVAQLGIAGISANGRAKRLRRSTVRASRLIVTATTAHRAEVLRVLPEAADRTFTLKEVARVLTDHPEARGVDAVLSCAAAAARTEQFDLDDDLADPHGLDDDSYGRMFTEADSAIDVLAAALTEDER